MEFQLLQNIAASRKSRQLWSRQTQANPPAGRITGSTCPVASLRPSFPGGGDAFAIRSLGLVATCTALVCVILKPGETATHVFLGSMAFTLLAWFVAFLKRRAVFCPLCKGTPLINSGARTHARARRILPFNHGTTAMLSILTTQTFRCMYCGSDFDLLKPPTRLRYGTPCEEDAADRHGKCS